ncbi:MAG: DUF1320 domain-containing protein [Patescibacteria group bacterium]
MSYATQADILLMMESATLINLTDDAGTGAIVEAPVTQALADADAEIDAYVGVKYTVPLDPVPAVVQKIAVDIAIYNLYSRRQNMVDVVRDRYLDAIKFLTAVSKGVASLGDEDHPAEGAKVLTADDNPARMFTRSSLADA